MIQGHGPVMQAFLGTLFTWGLTAAGAALVIIIRGSQRKLLDSSLGFAAGVMTAASYWSLLSPAIEMAAQSKIYGENGEYAFAPVGCGFLLGALFVYGADVLISVLGVHSPNMMLALHATSNRKDRRDSSRPNSHILASSDSTAIDGFTELGGTVHQRRRSYEDVSNIEEIQHGQWKRIMLLVIAITVHNVPEGLAVGVGFGAIGSSSSATFESASAELYAILEVLRYMTTSPHSKAVICSDSLSALQALQLLYPKNPIVQQITDQRALLHAQGKEVYFVYTPSHVGIPGNEEADALARSAHGSSSSIIKSLTVYPDFKTYMKETTVQTWQSEWNNSSSHLRKVKPTVGNILALPDDRKSQVTLSRLRLGHTNLTHSWILHRREADHCEFCGNQQTVTHLLKNCPALEPHRSTHCLEKNYTKLLTTNWNNLKMFLIAVHCYNLI